MRNFVISVFLLALFFCDGATAESASRIYPCFRPSQPPVVDGNVREDPVWCGLPVATGFSVLGGNYTLAKQTGVQACWDDEALYLAFVCEEPDVAMMKFKIHDGGDAWLDDGVEIFLQPGGAGKQVYQFIITGRGARSAFAGSPDFTKVQAAAHQGTDFYSLEIRIPFRILEAKPASGARWRGEFCRNIFTKHSGGDRFTSWTRLQTKFQEPEHFGELVLKSRPPKAAAIQALNNRLNQDYRQFLMKMVVSVSRQAPDYVPALNEATGDAEFTAAARDLVHRWQRLEKASRAASKVNLVELRSAAVDAGSLAGASDRVKYRYLIHKLLNED